MEVTWMHDLRGLSGVINSLFRNTTGYGTGSGPFGETDVFGLGQNTQNMIDMFPSGSGINEGGCSLWFKSSGCTNTCQLIFRGADDSNHFRWRVNSTDGSYHFQIYDANGTFRDTSVQMSADWEHLEIRWKIHDTTGYVIVRINGVEVARAEDIDTKGNAASTEVCQIYFDSGWCIGSWLNVAHLVMYTTTGPSDDWVGEHQIGESLVDGNGSNNQFTKVPGTGESAYENVDEKPFDSTTYNYSQTTGQKEDYTVATPQVVGTVLAVGHVIAAIQESAGSTQFKIGLITEGSNVDEGTYDINSDRIRQYIHVSTLNPDDSQAYELTDLDGMQVRVEIA